MNYILGFDIGNTNTVLGIYSESDVSPVRIFRFRTEREMTSDELGVLVSNFINIFKKEKNTDISIQGIAFSSVVTEVNRRYHEMTQVLFNLESIEIDCYKRLGISIRYDNPEELGSDRIVNAVAAYREYRRDCIIIDLGTATTFSILLNDGIFDGGLIGPGIGITIEALAERTSKLAKIDFKRVENIVAQNTRDAIKSGFFYGWISMISGIIVRIEDEYKRDFLPIITGGYSDIIGKNIGKNITVVDSLLTMKGIKYLYDLNSSN